MQNWLWLYETSNDKLLSFLSVDVNIRKFEYTSTTEIDPVDGWAIIGAIGGVWREYAH